MGGRRWCIWVRRRFDDLVSLVSGVRLFCLLPAIVILLGSFSFSSLAVAAALFAFSVKCLLAVASNHSVCCLSVVVSYSTRLAAIKATYVRPV